MTEELSKPSDLEEEEEERRDAPERQTTPFLVLQFFVFPMAIVAVCVAVFVIFGLIAGESKGAREYLSEVRTGSANRRWQAAFELSKVLQNHKDKALQDPRFVEEVVRAFEESKSDDPRVRRYLAVALGRLGDKAAVPALRKAVEAPGDAGSAADPETQVYAVWALGAIGDPVAIPDLVRLVESPDPGLRKAAVHALGAFRADEAQAPLVAALEDAVEDVRWNAALALARRHDARAAPVLLKMMDRGHLASVEGLTEAQRDDAMTEAVAAGAFLRAENPEIQTTLERLRESDPNLKVREAARQALQSS
jgi:HEAT repeat protein